MSVVLGLDVSTTATKAILLEGDGRVRGTATSEYPVDGPRPGWSEQDPERWWIAAVTAIRAVLDSTDTLGEEVDAIGAAGQMHGLVLLDGACEVLRPAILWNDQRTSAECDEIRAAVGADELIRI
ncbi:MAG TPA: FGGY family carbohydrate kinase, partial [Actinomycetota bacterium]